MLGDATTRQIAEMRDLLARGTLHGLPRVTIGDTVTVDADLAVRVVLANLDRVRQTGGMSPTHWRHIEEHIRRTHQAISGATAR